MPDTAPLRIAKYEITDFLGKGAMGVVYRGLDPLLNRYVAIKVMSQGIATDKELRDRFMREARAAGSLQHPNISTIYDFGEAEGSLYIAMEYIEGSDLSDIIERRDPIPVVGKIDIIVDVLHALDYAHSRGVVHRDVKPANIRVSVDGRAKLMDFGIARLEKSNLTKSGMMIGTPDYMAPEQVTGGAITGATDQFAVGVVLYEFLTNHRTFDGDTIHAVLYKVVSEQPPRLRDISNLIPGALQPILDRALAKDPAQRYASAGLMARDLTAVRTAQSGAATITVAARATPLRTERISVTQPSPKQGWRRPAMWAGVGAGVLVLGAAAVLAGGRLLRPADRDTAAPSPAPSRLAAAPAIGRAADSVKTADSARATTVPAVPHAAAPAESVSHPAPVTPPQERGAPHLGGARTALAEFGRQRTPDPARDGTPSGRALAQAAPAAQSPVPVALPASPPVTVPQPFQAAPAPQPSPSAAAPVTPAPASEAAPPDPRPQIEALVAGYARAIESRSVAEIRRYYPGLTGQQERNWEQFFGNIRGVTVQLAISRLELNGATVDLALTGRFDYDNKGGGGTQHQPVSFQATAAQSGGAWRLTAVR